ncbi:G-protein coupled receptor Mth2-like isoform X1 [Pogonomyrmex barbatus]|uniref:G-protein coupled receptor Mth2-like isoform X1 n=1 Tax=Pogonomyrmex barbatus TaxID=144034 RepID=A0A6I9W476_9HYME|nr:G-protein coupled receptor Mth2-like isoform X1 [Pogonomyrmex barbatus]
MRRQNLVLWCCALLFVASSSEPRGNSTTTSYEQNNNSTMQYEIHANISTTNRNGNEQLVRYNVRENSTKNDYNDDYYGDKDDDSIQHEFHSHSTKDHNDEISLGLGLNSTKIDDKYNSTSRKLYGDLMQVEERNNFTLYIPLEETNGKDIEKNVVPYETCDNDNCIQFCCPLGSRLIKNRCVAEGGNYPFPDIYMYEQAIDDPSKRRSEKLDQAFHRLTIYDPCQNLDRFPLEPDKYKEDDYVFFINGSLYQPYFKKFTEYCLAVLDDKYDILVCLEPSESETIEQPQVYGFPIGLIVSLPFLLTTFVVYTILPELWNMHGYTLRGYIGSLFVAYTVLAVIQLIKQDLLSDSICIAMAFIIHFSFLASFFWLNVMCFDIWWTFGGFRSLQGSVKQREKRKFVMYSIYAWGTASVFTIICAIMDFVPSVPKELIRPQFGELGCWFTTDEAKALYFYGPMTVTVICNICLFVSTALKIVRHRKDTAHHLRSSESRRHDDNKQWFNLYLKLFIVMGINWSMEIISWLFKNEPRYLWYLTDLTNTLQGLIIFIIFVWKEKIKRLLLKRFGCQENGLFSRNSTHSGCHSTASRTCTTTTSQGVMPLQEKISPYVQTNCRAKSSSDEADP